MTAKQPYRRTPEQLASDKAIRDKIQAEKPTLKKSIAAGNLPIPLGEYVEWMHLAHTLKDAREASGLSLADVAERSGIDRGALSRLENGHADNPTLNTLVRYLKAIGKKLVVSIADDRPS